MKIRVEFTLHIDPAELPALMEVAEADNLTEARQFVVREAAEYVADYLTNNGARVAEVVIPEKGNRS